ncbi:PIG-L family deacetylase [Paeniglutamicibacter sp. ZC-3]|uniref:PIG-L deacetylase family protein n=1 Tax=Paeniglutamicibacter sp. ZC-3 TaxID=2986919 RepID=UPI0021F7F048|nr:PIG-L deacetylase family protein [Paeniglutamicibacter sp. ZC-3]MCV9993353.1 PIG-L family deacetylase [Paeniglutamicibacter sp. ZC-3]
MQRVLCVVAHPDDMEYGASAVVAEWTSKGVEVGYLLLTSGESGIRNLPPAAAGPLRAEEQRRACEIVGVSDLAILDFPDGLLEPGLALRQRIAMHIRRFKPDAVMTMTWDLETPWGLNHADHRAAGLAVVGAIRDADNPWLFRTTGGEAVDEAWSVSWLLVTESRNTHAIPVSKHSVDLAVASLGAHEAYLAALPDHPPPLELITSILDRTGKAAGRNHALGVRAIRIG